MLSVLYNYIISIPFYFTFFTPSVQPPQGVAIVNYGLGQIKLIILINVILTLLNVFKYSPMPWGKIPYQRNFNAEPFN